MPAFSLEFTDPPAFLRTKLQVGHLHRWGFTRGGEEPLAHPTFTTVVAQTWVETTLFWVGSFCFFFLMESGSQTTISGGETQLQAGNGKLMGMGVSPEAMVLCFLVCPPHSDGFGHHPPLFWGWTRGKLPHPSPVLPGNPHLLPPESHKVCFNLLLYPAEWPMSHWNTPTRTISVLGWGFVGFFGVTFGAFPPFFFPSFHLFAS